MHYTRKFTVCSNVITVNVNTIHFGKNRSSIKKLNYSLKELSCRMVVTELPGCLEPSLLAKEKTEQQKLVSKYIYIFQTRNNFTDPLV